MENISAIKAQIENLHLHLQITARHETLLRVEKESHEHTREHLAQLRRASPTDNSQSLPPGSDAGSEAGDILVELRAERDALFAELEAWKFKVNTAHFGICIMVVSDFLDSRC